jgi:hypothetical protein
MPGGMSGIELLAVVWQRFPAIQKIAMNGADPRNVTPSAVAADGFFQKTNDMDELLRLVRTLPPRGRQDVQQPGAGAPLRIHLNGLNTSPATSITVSCSECLRAFSHPAGGTSGFTYETHCIHCGNSIQYAVVEAQIRA